MTCATDGVLWVEMPGLGEGQLWAALIAARRVMSDSGEDLEAVYEASWKPEAIEFEPDEEMSEREWALNAVWREAWKAAANAAKVERGLQLFPAELGEERHHEGVKMVAEGRQIVPPPDPGPIHRFDI